MTDKKQTTYLIISVIILAVGAIFYFQKYSDRGELGENNGLVGKEESTLDSDKKETPTVSIDGVKFSKLMADAQDSYAKGEYDKAIEYYKEALTIKKIDTPYSGMYNAYVAQRNWVKAREMLEKAIELNAYFTEYWKWKLILLDERTDSSFLELKDVYNEGLQRSDPKTKIDLITYFATVAENNGQKTEAISLWKEAIKTYPLNKDIYQAEIDRLSR